MRVRWLLQIPLIACVSNAWAVDGVGLGEMFPGLALLVWGAIVSCCTLLVFFVIRSNEPVRRKQQLRICWILGGAFFVAPYAFSSGKGAYVAYLCKTRAVTHVRLTAEEWMRQTAPQSVGGNRPVLVEFTQVNEQGLGVTYLQKSLKDPSSGMELMYSSSFSWGFAYPHGCAGNEAYWRERERFSHVSQINETR